LNVTCQIVFVFFFLSNLGG